MILGEFPAGPDQVIVVYEPPDTSAELDPASIVTEIAADAATRAEAGFRIISMTNMPLRHAGAAFGRQGSGYETSTALYVVYGRLARSGA